MIATSSTRAMILAAGRGERMRPLTDHTPKPLLPVRGKPLMQWPLEALARGGLRHAVINTAWLGTQISQHFGKVFCAVDSTHAKPVDLAYSQEGADFGGALETAGGIARALPLLCPKDAQAGGYVFWVLAGDVFAPDFVFSQAAVERFVAGGKLAHIWLVPNPAHNPGGDFGLSAIASDTGGEALALNLSRVDLRPRYTYSTIGLYRKQLFEPPWCDIAAGNPLGIKAALAPLLRAAMAQGLVSAELYHGVWTDVGTPERLDQLNSLPQG
jgi:MurNAc alpha-1-phosphate uridylyltransferase